MPLTVATAREIRAALPADIPLIGVYQDASLGEALRVHAGGIHAEGPDAPLVEFGHLIAHGGELAVSPGGVVAGIEDQGHV